MKTIKEYRKKLKLSQSEMASKLKVSIDTIKSWENNRRNPPPHLFDYLEMLIKNYHNE